MSDIGIGTLVTTALAVYAFGMAVFLISENRAPQATLAWMLGVPSHSRPRRPDLLSVWSRHEGLQPAPVNVPRPVSRYSGTAAAGP
jgi:hypothetical protein